MRAASTRRCLHPSREMSVDVVTFGCRLNAFESEVIAREAERAGLTDTIVINSCAVTNEAVAQARQSIRRLKRERPRRAHRRHRLRGADQAAMFAAMAEVDRVVGNDDKMRERSLARYARRVRRAPASASRQAKRSRSPTSWRSRRWRRICWRAFRTACRGCSCRCRTAAITAAPSASSPTAAAIRARCRWARWSTRSARWSSAAMPRSC